MTAPQNEAIVVRRHRWHQSTLSNLLDGCSWQYYLAYVLELDQGLKEAAAVGVAYHSTVEWHELRRIAGEETTLKEMISYGEAELHKATDDPDLHTKLRATLRNWWDHIRDYLMQHIPVAIEPEFTVQLTEGTKPLGGYIDGIYRDGETGEVFLLDHKTTKDMSRWKDGDGHRFQAALYAAATVLSPEFPEITELPEMRYLVVRTTRSTRANFEAARIVTVRPDLEDIRVLGDRIRQAEQVVASERYVRKPEWILCSPQWCPFYDDCMGTGKLSGTPTSVRERISTDEELSRKYGYRREQYETVDNNDEPEEVTNV